MGVIKRGFKNAFRNWVRTFSIVIILSLSIGLALTMLIARQAVQQKIETVKSSVGNTVSISPAGMRGFEGGGEALTSEQATTVQGVAHVNSVTETLNDRLTMTDSNLVTSIEAGSMGQRFSQRSGESVTPPPDESGIRANNQNAQGTRSFTPPITVLGTTAPTNLSTTQGGGSFKLESGQVFDGLSAEKVALVGKNLATKNNLNVGSTFTAYNNPIKVVGIFDAGNNFSNNQVIIPLAALQNLTNQPGQITALTANIDSVSNIDGATTAIQKVLGDKADVTNSADQVKQVVTPLENIKSISTISLLGSLVAGAIIIFLTMIMIVRERRREIGILKAIGASNIMITTQFIVESLTLTLLGAIFGLIIGVFASSSVTKLLVQNSTAATIGAGPGLGGGRGLGRFMEMTGVNTLQANVGLDIILYGLLAALIIAIIGSALPSWFISKIRPAEVMRNE